MAWWLQNNLRLVQNNLRDIDAMMDVDKLVTELLDFRCNTVMVGAGGITAFYPTSLPFQRQSPWLGDRDLLGEIVEKSHREGIRVIARFDFSKTHQSFYKEHPEWYYKSASGTAVTYNDTVHTCICGRYQQQYALDMIEEVLERYPVDGIFFNMFGFITADYSGNDYGICHCDACKKRFAAYSGGRALPETADDEQYHAFQQEVTADVLRRIHLLVRRYSPEIAVCTYHHSDVDIIRDESNSAVDRPLPFWLSQSASNVMKVRHNWNDKIISNCVINAADIFYRFSAVPPPLTKIRLYEEMAGGSGLDFCIIGVFEDYPDRESLEAAKEVFRFHRKNEEVYGRLKSLAKAVVLHPISRRDSKDFYGVFRALKELHIPFDGLADERVIEKPLLLDPYDVVIVPCLSDMNLEAVRTAHRLGKKLVLLGASDMPQDLQQLLGLKLIRKIEDNRAAYLQADESLPAIKHRGFILLDGSFGVYEGWNGNLFRVEKAWFGPPERCFGHQITEACGLLWSPDRNTAVVPWHLGRLYHRLGLIEYREILKETLAGLAPEIQIIGGSLPPGVELFWDKSGGQYLLQLLNLTGQNGVTVEEPLPLQDLQVVLPGQFTVNRVLTSGGCSARRQRDNQTCLTIDTLGEFAAVLLDRIPSGDG